MWPLNREPTMCGKLQPIGMILRRETVGLEVAPSWANPIRLKVPTHTDRCINTTKRYTHESSRAPLGNKDPKIFEKICGRNLSSTFRILCNRCSIERLEFDSVGWIRESTVSCSNSRTAHFLYASTLTLCHTEISHASLLIHAFESACGKTAQL